MLTRNSNLLYLILFAAAIFSLARPAIAEPVSINRGLGQGFIFQYNGNCFVILPQHVHGRSRTIEIGTSAPTVVGTAEMLNLRSPYDLSLGYVKPGLENRCEDRWDKIPADITQALDSRDQGASLVWVSASGITTTDPVSIKRTDLYTFDVKTQNGSGVFKGRSGSIVVSNGILLGLAIEAKDGDTATVLRMDEIKNILRRVIEGAAGNKPEPGVTVDSQNNIHECADGKILIKSITCSKFTRTSEAGCSALVDGGHVEFAPEDLPVSLEVEFEAVEPVAVGKVLLRSDAVQGLSTPPKSISVFVDSNSVETARMWRRFGGRDMSPDGRLTLVNGSGPYGKRLRIDLKSGWDDTLPTRLDCIAVDQRRLLR